MKQNNRFLLSILFTTLILMGALVFFLPQLNPDATQVSISTDKQVYHPDDIVHITIQNLGDRSVDIYCPGFCALGNFPTRVERFLDGQWQEFLGFCPSIEPLFGYSTYGGYIRHSLSAKKSFELEISNFDAQDQRLRIVYYLGLTRKPIYSNDFLVKP